MKRLTLHALFGGTALVCAAFALHSLNALQEAERCAPGARGPLEEGGAWDADLQVQVEGEWTTVTLNLTGPWDWGEALVARLADD